MFNGFRLLLNVADQFTVYRYCKELECSAKHEMHYTREIAIPRNHERPCHTTESKVALLFFRLEDETYARMGLNQFTV